MAHQTSRIKVRVGGFANAMFQTLCPNSRRNVRVLAALIAASATVGAQQQSPARFHLQEASIADIQRAILAKKITSVGLVELYLKRIKAYSIMTSMRHPSSFR